MRAWRPTAAAVSGITQPRASCDFHSSCRSGGRYSIANAASDESDASTAGTRSALSVPTSRQPSHFRDVSRHVRAPLRRHAQPAERALHAILGASRAHQPDIGRHAAAERLELRNGSRRDQPGSLEKIADRLRTTPQKSNLSMFSFVKSSGGPRITSLPRISILPSRPASIDAAPGASLFCAISAPAYTVR